MDATLHCKQHLIIVAYVPSLSDKPDKLRSRISTGTDIDSDIIVLTEIRCV